MSAEVPVVPATIEHRQTELAALHKKIFLPSNSQRRRAQKAAHSFDSSPSSNGVDLTDAALITNACAAKDGGKFNQLWDGKTEGYTSPSEADQALCNKLAFWTGKDAARMDALFRQSGLFRPKWDDVHSSDGRTYGELTIDAARTATGAVYQSGDQGLIKEMADRILRDHHFARDAGGLLYHYHEGVYRPDGDRVIGSLFQTTLEREGRTKLWSSNRANEITKYIGMKVPELWTRPSPDLINVQNGLVPLGRAPELLPHTPDHLCSIQLPVIFDPYATCPAWEQFLRDVMPEDAHVLLWELIAHLMIADTSFQKSFLFIGEGANGKSTLLRAIIHFLGRANVCSLSLQRLESDKFAVARLVGKLANICADLPSAQLTSSSMFKAIVGGDDIEAERKFQESFLFRPFTRLLFSANSYPQSKDSSEAFFRRWIVFSFERTFGQSEQLSPRILDAQLATPQERSGVLNRALAALHPLQRRGTFSECESTKGAWLEFREQTDPVANWLDLTTTEHPDALVPRGELHRKYNQWAQDHGRPTTSSKAFLQAVRRLRPRVQEGQRLVAGKMERVFLGLGIKDDPSPLTPSHHSHQKSQVGEREEKVEDPTANHTITPKARASQISKNLRNERNKGKKEENKKRLIWGEWCDGVIPSHAPNCPAIVSPQNVESFDDSAPQQSQVGKTQGTEKWCDPAVTHLPRDQNLFNQPEDPV